jgi:periplasmic protein TonB
VITLGDDGGAVIGREPARARKIGWVAGSIAVHLVAAGALLLWPEPQRSPAMPIVEIQIAPPIRTLRPGGAPPAAPRATPRATPPRRTPRPARPAPLTPPRELRDAPPPPREALAALDPADAALATASMDGPEFSGAVPGVIGGTAASAELGTGTGTGDGPGVGSPWLADRFREILRRIQRRIDRAPYPPQARVRGWTGLVRVAFVLRTDGTIAGLEVRESSGFTPLDRCALDAVRAAVPFPRPPRDEIVIVPIRFELVADG